MKSASKKTPLSETIALWYFKIVFWTFSILFSLLFAVSILKTFLILHSTCVAIFCTLTGLGTALFLFSAAYIGILYRFSPASLLSK